jgi:mannose-6-phosphate isomerase-like protein (cupin superfamily)
MRKITATDFAPATAWEALDIDHIQDATIRLHWTDQPYRWHVNDGAEVFVVLHGQVDMHVREGGRERVLPLAPGDIFHALPGDAHVAHPKGPAHVLVIEKAGSV